MPEVVVLVYDAAVLELDCVVVLLVLAALWVWLAACCALVVVLGVLLVAVVADAVPVYGLAPATH